MSEEEFIELVRRVWKAQTVRTTKHIEVDGEFGKPGYMKVARITEFGGNDRVEFPIVDRRWVTIGEFDVMVELPQPGLIYVQKHYEEKSQ